MKLRINVSTYLIIFFLFVFINISITQNAFSHPHVWIDTDTIILIDNSLFKGVKNHWKFDEYFSMDVIDIIDLNKNGLIDDNEQEFAFNETFVNLKKYFYYNHIRVNNKQIIDFQIKDFEAQIENNIVIYKFTILFGNPINITKDTNIRYSIYDDSYFMDIKIENIKDVHFTSTENLSYKIIEDKTNAIWYGMVFPNTVEIKGLN